MPVIFAGIFTPSQIISRRVGGDMSLEVRKVSLVLAVAIVCLCFIGISAQSQNLSSSQVAPGGDYPLMPSIAPIGVKIGKYLDVPASSQGPAIDPSKGYRLQDLGKGLYMITDNGYQSMFMVYDRGVVVVDAPTSFAALIPKAVAEVTDKPITHIVYSHSHIDHIAGAKTLGPIRR